MWRYLQLICWHDAKADVADVHYIQAHVAATRDHAQIEPYVQIDTGIGRRHGECGAINPPCRALTASEVSEIVVFRTPCNADRYK